MTRSRKVETQLTADEKDLLRGLASARRELKQFEQQVEKSGLASKTAAQPTRGLVSDFGALQSKALMVGAAVGGVTAATYGAGRVIAGLAGAASDLAESQNKANVVFGASSARVSEFAETSAQSFGLSKRAAFEAAGAYGNMFNTIGLGQAEASQMSVRLVQLAADMASFNNQDPSEMLQKLRAGLAGEAEPLRTVGVLLSEARVKTEAYTSGIAAQGAELTEAQKVQARYQLILKDTTVQHGDFARTSEGLANKQRALAAEFDNLKVKIGEGVVGPMTTAVGVANSLLGGIGKLVDLSKTPIKFDIGFGMGDRGSVGSWFGNLVGDMSGFNGAKLIWDNTYGPALEHIQQTNHIIEMQRTPVNPLASEADTPLSVGGAASDGFDWGGFNSWAMQHGVSGLNQPGLVETPKSFFDFPSASAGGSSAAARRIRSAGSLSKIDLIMGGLPGTPGGDDVAGFDAAVEKFKGIRRDLSNELAELGLTMADLSARGLENSAAFKDAEERTEALNDAQSRLRMVETLRIDGIRDGIEVTRAAQRAERERADEMIRATNDLWQQLLSRSGNQSAVSARGLFLAAAAAARGIEGSTDAAGNFTPKGGGTFDGTTLTRTGPGASTITNYGVINQNVTVAGAAGGPPPGITGTE